MCDHSGERIYRKDRKGGGVKMKYTINKRVGFSEVGPDKEIKLTSMVNYFQDCSTFQSEDIGLGMDVLKEKSEAKRS